MDKFKVDNFERYHAPNKFPWFRPLGGDESEKAARGLSENLGLPYHDKRSFAADIEARKAPVDGVHAEDGGFEVRAVLSSLNVEPLSNVLINWDSFDEVDEMGLADLNSYFADIWYPGPDNIDIFDATYSWMLSVAEDGAVTFVKRG